MEKEGQEQEAEAQRTLASVVEKLKTRMSELKENLEEKNKLDQKAAVEKYRIEQSKVSAKIYNSMKKELPK